MSAAEEAFARHGLMRLLGAELVEAADGTCVIEVGFRDDLTQHHGFIHAGVIGALLDTAGGLAAATAAGTEGVLTVEYKLNLLRPAAGERLRAEATVLRAGRNLVVTRGDAFVDGELCAAMQQTVMLVDPAGSPSGPAG